MRHVAGCGYPGLDAGDPETGSFGTCRWYRSEHEALDAAPPRAQDSLCAPHLPHPPSPHLKILAFHSLACCAFLQSCRSGQNGAQHFDCSPNCRGFFVGLLGRALFLQSKLFSLFFVSRSILGFSDPTWCDEPSSYFPFCEIELPRFCNTNCIRIM